MLNAARQVSPNIKLSKLGRGRSLLLERAGDGPIGRHLGLWLAQARGETQIIHRRALRHRCNGERQNQALDLDWFESLSGERIEIIKLLSFISE